MGSRLRVTPRLPLSLVWRLFLGAVVSSSCSFSAMQCSYFPRDPCSLSHRPRVEAQRPGRRILGGVTSQALQGRPTHPTPSSVAAFPPFPKYSFMATVSKQSRTPGTHGIKTGWEGNFRFCGKADLGTRTRSFPQAVFISSETQGQPDCSCGKLTCTPSSLGKKNGETGEVP